MFCSFSVPLFPGSSCISPGDTFFSHLGPFLSRGLKFSEITSGDLGCKTVSLNDTQASRKIAQPVKVAIAIKLIPMGNDSELGYGMGRTRLTGGPSRFMICLFSSLSKCSLGLECLTFHLQRLVLEGRPRAAGQRPCEVLLRCCCDSFTTDVQGVHRTPDGGRQVVWTHLAIPFKKVIDYAYFPR